MLMMMLMTMMVMMTTTTTMMMMMMMMFLGRYLAPQATTQTEMNLYFTGVDWNLAERYTDMIKTIFLSLFWSSILPVGVFLTSGRWR
jgi:hypothetical protein